MNWGWLDGRLTLAGTDLHSLPMDRAINAAYAVLVEEHAAKGHPRDKFNEKLRREVQIEMGEGEAAEANDFDPWG